MKIQNTIDNYLDYLIYWLEDNGWAGWDPYDIWDNKIGKWMNKRETIFQRMSGYIASYIKDLFPVTLRKVLHVQPRINAKAMGLFAAGFLHLEALENIPRLIKGEPGYESCFHWLEKNKIVQYDGCGWGYPFDWMSRIFIPRNTPTVVNSAIIGDAYWLKYKYQGDKKALLECENICNFILNGLNRTGYKDDGSFCFSYTPIDEFQVHNANLFAAEFLIRIGMETEHDDWIETGLAAANFSLSEIREDGTLNYWSNEQSQALQQDTYHSGFEIRSLNNIARLTNIKVYRQAANKYFHTWLRDFFSEEGAPCLSRGQSNIVEIHSCAEGILCATKMFESGNFPKEMFKKHIRCILSAVSKLWIDEKSDKGYFIYGVKNVSGFNLLVNIPYIRWGEAWMLNALAVLKTINIFEDIKIR